MEQDKILTAGKVQKALDWAYVMYIQIRMIAVIAYISGYDLKDDNVRSFVYLCLCGNAAKDVLKEAGIKIGMQFTHSAIRNVSSEIIKSINKAVGFRLLTRFGQKGSIKLVPLAGGIVGGAFDGISTNIIGNIARETFITDLGETSMNDDYQHMS
jgi:uncharacterized protein (DUF697 family)